MDYIAKGGTSSSAGSLSFVKIAEKGLISGSNPGTWASDQLIGKSYHSEMDPRQSSNSSSQPTTSPGPSQSQAALLAATTSSATRSSAFTLQASRTAHKTTHNASTWLSQVLEAHRPAVRLPPPSTAPVTQASNSTSTPASPATRSPVQMFGAMLRRDLPRSSLVRVLRMGKGIKVDRRVAVRL
jgi:hypothetical protein